MSLSMIKGAFGAYANSSDSDQPAKPYTVELQWLEHHWDHGNLFEIWVVRATKG